MRYQLILPRKIKFNVHILSGRRITKITSWIIDYSREKNIILLSVNVQEHYYKSKVWLWCTKSEKYLFARDLSDYCGEHIENLKF